MQMPYAFASRGNLTSEAEGVRFELTRPFGLPVFKTGAINRSATPPGRNTVREECAIAANRGKPKTTLAALCERRRGTIGGHGPPLQKNCARHQNMFM
jgi:hypothetical protein